MKIVMGSDHVGYEFKTVLKGYIESLGHSVVDIGAEQTERAEYPVYAKRAVELLVSGEAERAVLICGTGFGMALTANKVRGVRCVNCTEPYTALLSRQHNDSNALALGARVVGTELAKMIIDAFLTAEFEGGRHAARIEMIE